MKIDDEGQEAAKRRRQGGVKSVKSVSNITNYRYYSLF